MPLFSLRALAYRMLAWLGPAALVLLVALPAQAAKLALVVGIDSYDSITRLRNARADADTMATALQKAGYAVDLRTDRTLRQLQDDVRSFRQRIRGGDEVVFFFSGHGVQIGAANYLLPVDVRGQNEDQVRDDGLALNKVLEELRSAKPAFTLAVVDACRDNPFASAGRSIGGRGLTGVAGANGQMVIYAAGEGQQALDRLSNNDPVRNGLFTRVFARELTSPGVPVHSVLRRVRDEVYRLAQTVNHVQVPAIYDQVLGDFYFYPPPLVAGSARTEPVTVISPTPAGGAVSPSATCSVCPQMVVVPAGSFTMGSPASEAGRFGREGPQRHVTLPAFELGRTEETQGQWAAVMGTNPSQFKSCGDACPVENVSWNDVHAFIRMLNLLTGRNYRLPSESEWEYAARAGTRTVYSWGDKASNEYANYGKQLCCVGWAVGRDRWVNTAPVAQFPPNAFGLFDMSGNVWEMVQDVLHEGYAGAPDDGTARLSGGNQIERVVRGGSWESGGENIRSAHRGWLTQPDSRDATTGFRLARSL